MASAIAFSSPGNDRPLMIREISESLTSDFRASFWPLRPSWSIFCESFSLKRLQFFHIFFSGMAVPPLGLYQL